MGIYVIDKPLGLTSFDVVARAKKRLNTGKVGHTGTLDPLATGVLIVASNQSTKLVQFLEKDSKDYLAFISFGASTPTLDAEGPILETQAVSRDELRPNIEAALEQYCGPQMQMPPSYSAIHVNGERAYDLARKGQEVILNTRAVTVHKLKGDLMLESMQEFRKLEYRPYKQEDGSTEWHAAPNGFVFNLPEPLGEFPTLMLNVSVSSGTYIRSLARDIGLALGVPAHLAGLVRTQVGKFKLEDAQKIETLEPNPSIPDLDALDLSVLELSLFDAKRIRDGKLHTSSHVGLLVATCEGELVAVLEGDGQNLKVRRAWAAEDQGKG